MAEEEADQSVSAAAEMLVDLNEDIVLSMAKKREIHKRSRESRGQACTIYKLSDKIKKEYPTAYEPQIVSIGPFHHGNPKLLPMEAIKWQFLDNLIGRHESNSLDKYINAVSKPSFVQKITNCYSEQVMGDDGRNTLVEIMVLDGCFIIEFLVKFFLREPMGEIGNLELVKNDLLLIENQIPFSVLQLLFKSFSVPGIHDNNLPISITDLAEYIISFDGYDRPATAPKENHQSLYLLRRFYPSPPQVPSVIHHYLHLRHYSLRPTPTEELQSPPVINIVFSKIKHILEGSFFLVFSLFLACRRPTPTPASYDGFRVPRTTASATELDKTGIRFEPNKRARSILEVTFRVTDYVMEIPVLTLKATSMSQFRNLLALEQCIPDIGNHVTSFVLFMNCLINTPEDVKILVESGVLESKLASEEVVLLFNTLGEAAYLDYDQDYLGKLYKDVKYYCAQPRNRWRADLMKTYFTNPWATITFIQAVLALVLSMVQSILAILAYFNPRHKVIGGFNDLHVCG